MPRLRLSSMGGKMPTKQRDSSVTFGKGTKQREQNQRDPNNAWDDGTYSPVGNMIMAVWIDHLSLLAVATPA